MGVAHSASLMHVHRMPTHAQRMPNPCLTHTLVFEGGLAPYSLKGTPSNFPSTQRVHVPVLARRPVVRAAGVVNRSTANPTSVEEYALHFFNRKTHPSVVGRVAEVPPFAIRPALPVVPLRIATQPVSKTDSTSMQRMGEAYAALCAVAYRLHSLLSAGIPNICRVHDIVDADLEEVHVAVCH